MADDIRGRSLVIRDGRTYRRGADGWLEPIEPPSAEPGPVRLTVDVPEVHGRREPLRPDPPRAERGLPWRQFEELRRRLVARGIDAALQMRSDGGVEWLEITVPDGQHAAAAWMFEGRGAR